MTRQIKKLDLYIRSALFIDQLRADTHKGFVAIWQQVRKNQYEANGLVGPGRETVNDYFRLRWSLSIDPTRMEIPWLVAADMEFVGSAYYYFHPIVDLLMGQLESSIKWRDQQRTVHEKVIRNLEKAGLQKVADEWRAINEEIRKRPGRPPKVPPIDQLTFIHLTMMRLREPAFSILFNRKGLAHMYARNYAPIMKETRALARLKSLDGIAGLIGLVFEAAEIGDVSRHSEAVNALRSQLASIDKLQCCKHAAKDLKALIEIECLGVPVRRYSRAHHYDFGIPATWQARLINPQMAYLRKILSQSR